MTSQELGRLFETATWKILNEMFRCWGFTITDSKVQKSGSQHGFDVVLQN